MIATLVMTENLTNSILWQKIPVIHLGSRLDPRFLKPRKCSCHLNGTQPRNFPHLPPMSFFWEGWRGELAISWQCPIELAVAFPFLLSISEIQDVNFTWIWCWPHVLCLEWRWGGLQGWTRFLHWKEFRISFQCRGSSLDTSIHFLVSCWTWYHYYENVGRTSF